MNDSYNFGFDEEVRRNRNFLQRTAKEAKVYLIKMRLARSLFTALSMLAIIGYVTSVLYMKTGSFTVNIDKFEANKYSLSLAEKPYSGDKNTISGMTSNLNSDINESITCISASSIPANVNKIDGVHNGDNYIAYSFYLVNAGEYDVTYEYEIVMKNISNEIDEAIRIRLYTDNDYVTYAKTKSDGTGPEEDTVEFVSMTTAVQQRVDAFTPNSSHRYTVVVWIEGDDPDCVDSIIGGKMKIEMNFKVVY